MNKKLVAGFVATFVVGVGIGASGNSNANSKTTAATPRPTVIVTATRTVTASPAPASSAAPAAATDNAIEASWTPQDWASHFKSWVSAHGTSHQKSAAQHVTEIKGLTGDPDDLSMGEVNIYTDFGGSEFDHHDEATIIIQALGDWQKSPNGDALATVYSASGAMEGNGNI